MKKNKVLKISVASLALLMSAGYVTQNIEIMPTYAQVSKTADSVNLISNTTTWKYLDTNVDPGSANVLLNQYINGTSGDDIPTFFFRTTVNINNVDDVTSVSGNYFMTMPQSYI